MGNYSAATTVEITKIITTLDAEQMVNDVAITAVLHGPSGLTYTDEGIDLGTPPADVQQATQPGAQQILAAAQALVGSDFAVGTTVALQSITTLRAYDPSPVTATLAVTFPDGTTRTVQHPGQITPEVEAAMAAGTAWVEQQALAHYELTTIFAG